jgi:hypothetical protein
MPTTTTQEERLKNMDKNFPDVLSQFKNIQIYGTAKERAVSVFNFLERKSGSHHIVIADWNNGKEAIRINTKTGLSEFTNNGMVYLIVELKELNKVEDFKKKVILAIDSAEIRGGSLREKRDRFLEIFTEKVNLVVSEGDIGTKLCYKTGFYFRENRNGTVYRAWLN